MLSIGFFTCLLQLVALTVGVLDWVRYSGEHIFHAKKILPPNFFTPKFFMPKFFTPKTLFARKNSRQKLFSKHVYKNSFLVPVSVITGAK